MYGNLTLATKSSDCLPCPFNTFNNLKGQFACRPCGSSATAVEGSSKCQCLGKKSYSLKIFLKILCSCRDLSLLNLRYHLTPLNNYFVRCLR